MVNLYKRVDMNINKLRSRSARPQIVNINGFCALSFQLTNGARRFFFIMNVNSCQFDTAHALLTRFAWHKGLRRDELFHRPQRLPTKGSGSVFSFNSISFKIEFALFTFREFFIEKHLGIVVFGHIELSSFPRWSFACLLRFGVEELRNVRILFTIHWTSHVFVALVTN